MSQPKWKCIGNLGDRNPLDYGGYFVFVDKTGVYPPEAELLELDDENDERTTYTVHRFILEPCTYIDGILSDNRFHPDKPAWFAGTEDERKERPQDSTYLKNLADYAGLTVKELAGMFCDDAPLIRAEAWRIVGQYHGFENLDNYPLTKLSRTEVRKRYPRSLL